MAGADGPVEVTKEQLGICQGAEYDGPVEYDLGNMTAFSPSPVNQEDLARDTNGTCHRVAQLITQNLVAHLFQLPSAPSQDVPGRIAQLPDPTTRLPRAKPLPKPRPPTKWEVFAARKGIKKQKRSKLEWDEAAGEWRRRHGYKRVNDESEIPIAEAGKDDKVGEDPFTAKLQEKKQRVQAQEKRRLQNLKAAAKAAGTAALPPTLRLAASLPEHGRGKPVKRKDLKSDFVAASKQAGVATASQGKFDRRLHGERDNERRLPGGGPKPLDVGRNERSTVAGLADRIVRERADDIVDADRAAGHLEAERRAKRHAEKQAAASEAGGRAGKKSGGQRAAGGNKKSGPRGTKKGQGSTKGLTAGSAGGFRKGGKVQKGGKKPGKAAAKRR